MWSVPKPAPAALVAGALIAALFGLTACGGDEAAEPATESTPTQTLEVVAQGFDTTEDLSDYLSESLEGVEVRLESESNPDYDEDVDADRLYVDFASDEQRSADMEATAAIVQASSRAAFDFDVLMVTGDVSAGEWSYLYNRQTVEKLTEGERIAVADVWDAAEQDFDTIHR